MDREDLIRSITNRRWLICEAKPYFIVLVVVAILDVMALLFGSADCWWYRCVVTSSSKIYSFVRSFVLEILASSVLQHVVVWRRPSLEVQIIVDLSVFFACTTSELHDHLSKIPDRMAPCG